MARRAVTARVALAVACLAAAASLAAGQLSTGFGTVDTSPQAGGLAGNDPVSETPDGVRSHRGSGELLPPGSAAFPGEEGPSAVPDGSGLLPDPEVEASGPPPPEVPGVLLPPKPGGRRGGGGAGGEGTTPAAAPGAGVAVGHRAGDPEVFSEGMDPDAAAALQRAGLLGAGGRAASNLFVPAVGGVAGDDAPPADKAVRDGVDPFFSLAPDSDGDGEGDAAYINPDGSIAGGNANYGKNHVKKRIQITLDSPGGPGDALVCHFPSGKKDSGGGVDPYNVRPLKLPAPAADLLLAKDSGNGFDFEAPPPGERVFGPGCVSYDARCSFGNNGIPCSGHGICASTIPNSCLCMNGFKTCRDDSNGCETNVNLDPDNCGACGRKCNTTASGGNEICCQGQCLDPAGTGGPTIACGRCGAVCATIPSIQNGSCTAGACDVTCDAADLTVCPALQPGTGISLPICVDLGVNPLFCGNCSYACPFDANGLTRCGAFGPNGTTACSVECSPSFPTQCGTLGDPSSPANNPDSGLRPTSSCVNLLTDPDNCGGCGKECPQSTNAVTTCGISPVTGKPACSFACNAGLVPCTNVATGLPFCANIFGYDPFNCGGCGFVCSAGYTCFQGTCLPGFPYIGGGGGGFFGGSFFGGTGGLGFVDTKRLNGSRGGAEAGAAGAGAAAAPADDQRPAALRPPVISPASPSRGDVAVFPSYPEWWDNPAAAAAAGVPGAAAVAAGAPGAAGSRLAAYLAARPGLADGTLKLSTVLAEQHEAAAAAGAGGDLPPNVDVAQCTWATAEGEGGAGRAASAGGKKGAKAAAKAETGLARTAPPKPRVEVFLKASLPEDGATAEDGAPAPGGKGGKGAKAGAAPAARGGAPAAARSRAAEAAAYGYGAPAPAGVDDARFQTANILARQFEGQAAAAAAAAGGPAAAAAPARARAARSAPPTAAPAAPAPHAAAHPAAVVSVADDTSTVTARRAADAAGAAAGAAERAGVGSARAAAAAARGVVDAPPAPRQAKGGGGAFPKELGN